jgi:hypothetical protein
MMSIQIDQEKATGWSEQANGFMFNLIKSKPDGFCADDFNDLCVEAEMPADTIKRLSGKLFREFQAANHITKTSQFTLSKRNSAPLPIWIAVKETKPC